MHLHDEPVDGVHRQLGRNDGLPTYILRRRRVQSASKPKWLAQRAALGRRSLLERCCGGGRCRDRLLRLLRLRLRLHRGGGGRQTLPQADSEEDQGDRPRCHEAEELTTTLNTAYTLALRHITTLAVADVALSMARVVTTAEEGDFGRIASLSAGISMDSNSVDLG